MHILVFIKGSLIYGGSKFDTDRMCCSTTQPVIAKWVSRCMWTIWSVLKDQEIIIWTTTIRTECL